MRQVIDLIENNTQAFWSSIMAVRSEYAEKRTQVYDYNNKKKLIPGQTLYFQKVFSSRNLWNRNFFGGGTLCS